MSEYQYYEFVAVDGPISDEGLSYARGCSTRAEVSRYRWRNVYNWGEFRGDPIKLLQHYDAHVYVTNWATFVFAIGLPSECVDEDRIEPYLWDTQWANGLRLSQNCDRTVISWERVSEDGGYEYGEEESLLDGLVGIREEILYGDMRAFFLGWLAGVNPDEPPASVPPIPSGMAELTPPQRELADQLHVDQDGLAAAAAFSSGMQTATARPDKLIDDLPPEEARSYLKRVACGEGARVMNEINRRASAGREAIAARCEPGAFAAKLLELRETRLRQEAEARKARRRAKEAARKRRIVAVFQRAERTWIEIDSLMKTRKNAAYDDIAATLKELADAYAHKASQAEFQKRLSAFRSEWSNRPAMMRRIEEL